MSEVALRLTSAVGFVTFIGIAYALSRDRKRIIWSTVRWGVALQLTKT